MKTQHVTRGVVLVLMVGLGLQGRANAAMQGSVTAEFINIDDFESYTDDIEAGQAIFQTWTDGWYSGTGSRVGHLEMPFAERVIVHRGSQSLPLGFNNLNSPFFSETRRVFAPPLNLAIDGVDVLILYLRGGRGNDPAPIYVALEDAAGHLGVAFHPDRTVVRSVEWVEWETPLSQFRAAGVNLAAVTALYLGIGDRSDPVRAGVGSVYIDDICATWSRSVPMPCTETTGAVPATDPNVIRQFPILTVVDAENDLNLINPLNAYFQDDVRRLFDLGDFGDLYRDYDLALVPKVLDIQAVRVVDTGQGWRFTMNTFDVGSGPSPFQALVSSGQARVALYLDTDLDSISDTILTTVTAVDGAVRMAAVNNTYQRLVSRTGIAAQWDDATREFTVEVPVSLSGRHYDWVLVTGWAIRADASCAAVQDESIRWVPTVDIVVPDCATCFGGQKRSIDFLDSFRSASPCQVYSSHALGTKVSCPLAGQPQTTLPGPMALAGAQGWLAYGVSCGQRQMRLYCSKDWVGWVDNGVEAGWFARCCFGGGQNATASIDTDSDGVPDGWMHTVAEPYGASPQKIEYVYKFGPPYTYEIRRYSGTQLIKTCTSLQLTNDPWSLPGSRCSYP